jgi:hypothetical protein
MQSDNNNNSNNNTVDEVIVDNNNPSPVNTDHEDAANGGNDDDSLSPSNLMATMSPFAAASDSEEEEDDDDDTPGEVQLLAEDDSKVKPADKNRFILMMAPGNVPGFDRDEFSNLAERAGKKIIMKPTKAMALLEIKRLNPRTKYTTNSRNLNQFLNMLTPLTDDKDVAYVTRKVEGIKKSLLDIIAIKEAGVSNAAPITSTDRLRCTGLHLRDDVYQAFQKRDDTPTREELDAGETPSSKYHALVVRLHNDASVEVVLGPFPSLGYNEPIVCEKGDFEMTVEKSKKLDGSNRRSLNAIIDRYERSGNGSNQHAHNRGEFELEEGASVDSLWGRTTHAQRDQNEAGNGQDETECGDDRANFLRSEPKDILVTWQIFDKLDMIRKVCAKLGESHRASSEATPPSTARGSRSRKTPRPQEDGGEDDEGMTPKELDLLFFKAQKIRRLDRQVMVTVERLDQLKTERFELYMRAEDEEKESKRIMLNARCEELTKVINDTQEELKEMKECQQNQDD